MIHILYYTYYISLFKLLFIYIIHLCKHMLPFFVLLFTFPFNSVEFSLIYFQIKKSNKTKLEMTPKNASIVHIKPNCPHHHGRFSKCSNKRSAGASRFYNMKVLVPTVHHLLYIHSSLHTYPIRYHCPTSVHFC